MGLFSGTRPAKLGYSSGMFTPPSWKPNCVLSTVDRGDKHYVEPFVYAMASGKAWEKLHNIVLATKGAKIITDSEGYLYAEFRSGILGFVDDVEFAMDKKARIIQVRSASRLGIDDVGVNRKRIERIRRELLQD